MKKSFFRKLSFVLALAMIVSVIAPAAGAFAATKPAVNTSKKYLFLGESGKNEYDFNVKNKIKGSTYEWSSDNESVAVVDDKGYTTAKSVGTTTISLLVTDKKGNTYPSEATVIVKDNIKSLAITNKPANDTLAVDVASDFNRSFTTQGGSTKKTTSVTRWVVTDADGKATDKATIDNSGVFKATEAGTYKITANAFQSTAKYDTWKTSGDSALIQATDTTTVTVTPSIVSTKQVDADTFAVTFDSDMSKTDVVKASVLYQVIAGKQVSTGAEKIKSITLSTDGKVATVDVYTALAAGAKYNFVFDKLVGEFTAATKDLADITGITFSDLTVTTGGSADLYNSVVGYNKDGVIIYTSADVAFKNALSFSLGAGAELSKAYVSGNLVYLYSNGYAAPIKVTFSTSVYNSTTKTYESRTFEDTAVATGVTTSVTSNLAFQVSTAAPTSSTWSGNLTVAAGDSGYAIFEKYYLSNDTSKDLYTTTANELAYSYTTTDSSKLLINGIYLYPVNPGTVTVIVKASDGTPVTTFDVVITAARAVQVPTQSASSVTVGNNSTYGETASVDFYVKDTAGSTIVPSVSASVSSAPSGANTSLISLVPSYDTNSSSSTYGKATVSATAHGATPGAYNIKVSITGVTINGASATKDLYFTLIVLDSSTTSALVVTSWNVALSDGTVDLNALYSKSVTVDVYGYNAAGLKVAKLATGDYTYNVLSGSDTVIANALSTATIPVVTAVSGSPVTVNRAVGTYNVVANLTAQGVANSYFAGTGRVAGSYVAATTLTVKDTTTLGKTLVDPVFDANDTILQAIQEAYTFTLNGTEVTSAQEANIVAVKYSVGDQYGMVSNVTGVLHAGQNVYVESFTYRVIDGTTGAYIDYVYTVGASFNVY
jgi:hypothetical protein